MKLDSQKPTVCIHLFFVVTLTIELTLHIIPSTTFDTESVFLIHLLRIQNKKLSIHIKIYYSFTSTCEAVLYLDEDEITYYVT